MIAFFGLLALFEPGVEFLLTGKCGPVNSLHLLARRVALPVRTRKCKQFESSEFARVRHVRPEAKIDERRIVDIIDAGRIGDLVRDQLAFERLFAALKNVEDPGLFDDLAAIGQVLLRHRLHFLFDHRQVCFGQLPRSDNVVIVAVTRVFHQRRADAELCARKKVEDGGREQVSGRMADQFQAVVRIGRDRLDDDSVAGLGQVAAEIDLFAVYLGGQGALQHIAVDCLKGVQDRRRRRERPQVITVFYVNFAHILVKR